MCRLFLAQVRDRALRSAYVLVVSITCKDRGLRSAYVSVVSITCKRAWVLGPPTCRVLLSHVRNTGQGLLVRLRVGCFYPHLDALFYFLDFKYLIAFHC